MTPKKETKSTFPTRKNLSEVKTKYSPLKRTNSNVNNAYVKGFKFGLMSLQLKKSFNPEEDAFFKNFEDDLNSDARIAEKLGIIKIVNVRNSKDNNDYKMSQSGYR